MPNDQQLQPDEIEQAFTILSNEMPGRVRGSKGPKRQPNPFRSCVACMLSAQSRDAKTALATKALFKLARTPWAMLQLSDRQIKTAIKPCGLCNAKTKNIRNFCQTLLQDFDGVVPSTRGELMMLPGIGRKCADIVLQFAFEIDTIAVDTHVHRVRNRIGIARGKTAAKTAEELEQVAPLWAMHEGHFWLIQFGKRICVTRSPKCDVCPISRLCLKRAEDAEKNPDEAE